MIGNYYFEPTAVDLRLLENLAKVATMAHAPFIGAAAPGFFGLKDSFERLPALKDLQDIFSGTRYTKWQSFRESEDSRYVGLALPRFLLRQPYDPDENPVKAFVYKENVDDSHHNFLWGNAAFAFATRITESFAKYRWAANIIGPRSGGAVEDLPVHLYESLGDIEMKIPTEVLISDRREYELAEPGLHRPDHAQGLGQCRLLLRQLLPEAQVLRHLRSGQGRRAQLPPGRATALSFHCFASGPLHQGLAARATSAPGRNAWTWNGN